MLINGKSVRSKKSIEVVNPATGKVTGQVPEADHAAIQQALQAAAQGFKVWSNTTPAGRKTIILRYADLLEQNRQRIVDLLIAETGKPQDNAIIEALDANPPLGIRGPLILVPATGTDFPHDRAIAGRCS